MNTPADTNVPRERKLTGKILFRPVDPLAEPSHIPPDPIPFLPAWDLYEAAQKAPTAEEVVAIGVALAQIIPAPHSPTEWQIASRLAALRGSL